MLFGTLNSRVLGVDLDENIVRGGAKTTKNGPRMHPNAPNDVFPRSASVSEAKIESVCRLINNTNLARPWIGISEHKLGTDLLSKKF